MSFGQRRQDTDTLEGCGYTNKVPSGSQSPAEGNPPAALSHRLRGLMIHEILLVYNPKSKIQNLKFL
jgi:hypothetical protein